MQYIVDALIDCRYHRFYVYRPFDWFYRTLRAREGPEEVWQGMEACRVYGENAHSGANPYPRSKIFPEAHEGCSGIMSRLEAIIYIL